MQHKRLGAALFAAAIFWVTQPAHALFDLYIEPVASDIQVGDTVDVDVLLDATGTGFDIIGFGVDLLFDSSILGVDSAAVNTVLFDGFSNVVETPGRLAFDGLTLGASHTGLDILLASVTFSGDAVGLSALTFDFPDLGTLDGLLRPIPPGGAVAPDIVRTASINVTSVPLPATLALMLLGLVSLRRFA